MQKCNKKSDATTVLRSFTPSRAPFVSTSLRNSRIWVDDELLPAVQRVARGVYLIETAPLVRVVRSGETAREV